VTSPAAEAFYAARDLRTAQLGGQAGALSRPVHLIVGRDAAASRAGQVAVIAAANMLARVHRELHFAVPAVPALARGLAQADDLPSLVRETALAINPFLMLTVTDTAPAAGNAGTVVACHPGRRRADRRRHGLVSARRRHLPRLSRQLRRQREDQSRRARRWGRGGHDDGRRTD
jgi:hypothetical protein